MAKIKIITDSASDISFENEEKYGIKIIPFKVAMGDESYISRVDFDNEKFYKMIETYDGIPATSQITTFEYQEIFENIYNEGYTDIINVTINSEASATYGNSVMAAANFFEEHPEAKEKISIYNIDSKNYTGGYGYPIVEAAKMAENGTDVTEIVKYLEEWFEKLVIYFAPYTLQYAKKSGRIPSAAAFVGEVIGLRPIMRIFDKEIKTADKVRGDKNIVPKIAEITKKEIEAGTPYCIVYGNDKSVGEDMAKLMTELLGYPPIDFYQIGAAITVNAGPKVVGVIFSSAK